MQALGRLKMKKGIITLFVALCTVCSAWAGTPSRIVGLVRQYEHHEGFEVVNVGRLLIGGLRGAIRLSGDLDDEDRVALKAFDGIRRLTIVDFEDASEADKSRFCSRVESLLSKMELIMEAKDEDGSFRIYGLEDGSRLKDVIVYSSGGTLISVKGFIDFDHLGNLMEIAQ